MITPILLTAVALAMTGHTTTVTCTTDTGFSGFASVGQPTVQPQVWISTPICRLAKKGDGIGVFVFLHEVGHTTGITDEHQADCYAMDHLYGALRRFWHQSVKTARANTREGIQYMWRFNYGCVR